ncbi:MULTISPECIES: MbtH family protein [Polymorphospora]|uniref:MbtH protein n=2 Tax=Polymorphospora TaxID=338583 RepID=A0A810N5A9_9ACTN|nr:MbtH family NRPS accessory protein [Polymorphospora rubra]BCJ66655.1 MbtH protein [Polymorphospora rubra]
MSTDTDLSTFAVVVNDEEQYSVWPAGRTLPAGWRETGFTGPRGACLAHVDEVWTDLRPKSLRQRMGA